MRIAQRRHCGIYMNSPIGRKPLMQLFASVLRHDEDGKYYLVTPVEKCGIRVDDAPFVAVRDGGRGQGPGAGDHVRDQYRRRSHGRCRASVALRGRGRNRRAQALCAGPRQARGAGVAGALLRSRGAWASSRGRLVRRVVGGRFCPMQRAAEIGVGMREPSVRRGGVSRISRRTRLHRSRTRTCARSDDDLNPGGAQRSIQRQCRGLPPSWCRWWRRERELARAADPAHRTCRAMPGRSHSRAGESTTTTTSPSLRAARDGGGDRARPRFVEPIGFLDPYLTRHRLSGWSRWWRWSTRLRAGAASRRGRCRLRGAARVS